MSYAILDNNRFYAEGLCYALLQRSANARVQSDAVRWLPMLLCHRVLVIRCRFSLTAPHHVLIDILLRLEAARWQGSLYLICNEKGWALAAHLRDRFSSLTIYITDDRMAVTEAARLLTKDPRRLRRPECSLTEIEFRVLDLMLTGRPVRHIARVMHISEKRVSTHKCSALKKLNVDNLLQLLL
ncbi:DNA-binding transcriptional activator EvgA [Cedecea lapagei]|uniref:DNA-binding transcriptional activator EvgA n=1 Tax=Cedecea lapagei TaxID=158823 RepID=A0A447V4C7_9ENTR|nr:LuxR C-terminal-related transcriptional regulator [Cedecea lapagei]VEB99028.1 DNA-binding transcriptional activator EvgA [Cedecea lapagei]